MSFEKIHSETFFLSAGETNAEGELSLPLLTSRLIDIATAHANALGIGNPAMTEESAGWVLSRLTVEMNSYPTVNTRYTIQTWIESWNRHFSERCFRIVSDDGSFCYGVARSVWMVMNTVERKNVGLSHLHLPDDVITGQSVDISRQSRHHFPQGANPVKFRFGYADLDAYRHVNTVRYVALLLNQFTLEDFDKTMVHRLELAFMHEVVYGTEVDLLRSDDDESLCSLFAMNRSTDNTPLVTARLVRKNR